METTYDVRIWSISVYKGTRKTTYYVRWRVGEQNPFKRAFATSSLAKNFRSQLTSAASTGEAFRLVDGLPVSMARENNAMTWFAFARKYAEMKWPTASPGHRRNIAEALEAVTRAMGSNRRGEPDAVEFRRLVMLAFTSRFDESKLSPVEQATFNWIVRNSRDVGDLAQPPVARQALNVISTKLDGSPAAQSTTRRKRMTLINAIAYAIECELLNSDPLQSVKHHATSRKTRPVRTVDKRAVPNPVQARCLLWYVGRVKGSGKHLKAFFGCMYYAGLRPEEAAMLHKENLSLPDEGWGELNLAHAAPEIGGEWTDSGTRSEARGLKHREFGETRPVPCPPELTELLHEHMRTEGVAADGRLFRGQRDGGRVASSVYSRVWSRARAEAFAAEVAAGPLAKTPYDLRHACVSTWLKAGVEPPRVAAWAGHSLRVLLDIYAKFLDGGEQAALGRIDAALRGS